MAQYMVVMVGCAECESGDGPNGLIDVVGYADTEEEAKAMVTLPYYDGGGWLPRRDGGWQACSRSGGPMILPLKGFPRSRRTILEGQVHRMRQAATALFWGRRRHRKG